MVRSSRCLLISSNFRPVELDAGLLPGVRDAERGLVALGERLLAALGLEEEVVEDFGVVERVGRLAGLGAELLGQVHHDGLVPEDAPQAMVAAGADDADEPVLDLDHRDVERAAAQVVDQDHLVFALLQAVGDGRRPSARSGSRGRSARPAGPALAVASRSAVPK